MTKIRPVVFTCASALFAALNLSSASAITVEVARKCDALVATAFPPRLPGNPAAGSAKGSGFDEQAYFKKCVANGGRPPSTPFSWKVSRDSRSG
jgi:hypothetical protein